MSLVIRKYPDLTAPTPAYGGKVYTAFSAKAWKHFLTPFGEITELTPLDGVTGVVKVIDKSSALVPWAVKQALMRCRRLILEQGLGPDGSIQLFVDELDAILAASKKADNDILEDAAAVGHVAHDHAEQTIKSLLSGDVRRTCELLAITPEDERAENAFVAVIDFTTSHNVRWTASEQRALSLELQSCGTADGLCYMDSCDDRLCCPTEYKDVYTLIDFKTSNCVVPYVSYLYQTALYQQAIEEEHHKEIANRFILLLEKTTGDFSAWGRFGRAAFEKDLAGFKHCLNLTRSLRDVQSEIDAMAQARRDRKKEAKAAEKEAATRLECPKAKDYKGSRMTKCLPDGSQCGACRLIYERKHANPPPAPASTEPVCVNTSEAQCDTDVVS